MVSGTGSNNSNVDTRVKNLSLMSFSNLIDSLNRQDIGFVLRDSNLREVNDVGKAQFIEIKLGPEKVQGFYTAAIIVKDPVALSRCETLRSIISKTTSIACPRCPRCGSRRLAARGSTVWCIDCSSYTEAANLSKFDWDRVYIVRLDLTGVDSAERVLGKEGVLEGDNLEIRASGYVTISRLCEVERGFDHIYTVMYFELKDIVERLGLKALSRLSRAPEEQEIERLANELGVSKELVAQLKELGRGRKVTERLTKAAKLVADAVIEHFKYVKNFCLVGGGDIGIHCFDGKRWRECENDILSYISKVYKALKLEDYGVRYTALEKEVLAILRDSTRERLKYDSNSIAFDNCVFDWDTFSCEEHKSDKIAFHYIPYNIDVGLFESILKEIRDRLALMQQEYEAIIERYASTYTPKTLKAFKEWVGGKWILLYEILGFTLYPKSYKKAVLLTDTEGKEGDTGKSTYIRYLQLVLGRENYSNVPLQALMDSSMRFMASQIYRKLANFYADLPEEALMNLGTFKVLTGEDGVTIERKYREPFSWIPYTKHIFSANTPPPVSNADTAFWKRWLVVQFIGSFEKKVREFEKTLSDEIPKAIAIGIACFYHVLQRGVFSYEGTAEDSKNLWLAKVDSVYAFMEWMKSSSLLRKSENVSTKIENLYEVYVNWCEVVGEEPVSQSQFTKRLKQLGYAIVKKHGYSYIKSYALGKEQALEMINKMQCGVAEPST
jgi:phage/plasmid-associated DNA primase